jgi:hypothetical protein
MRLKIILKALVLIVLIVTVSVICVGSVIYSDVIDSLKYKDATLFHRLQAKTLYRYGIIDCNPDVDMLATFMS